MHSPPLELKKKIRKKKSQTFSQPMLRSIWFWSELCFSDLFLLEVKLKPPAPNTRTLGQFRFSCYLNLVQGASTRHKNNPLTRKPSLEMVPLLAISFEQEEHNESTRCVHLYMYISIQPLSSMCSTWMPAYQMPSFCWVLFFFLIHRLKKCNLIHNFFYRISPEAGELCHLALFLSTVQQTKFSLWYRQTPQFQVCFKALLERHRARAMALECSKEAIQRHHALSMRIANTNVKDDMLHGSLI